MKRTLQPRYNRRVRRHLILPAGVCLLSALVIAASSDRPKPADGLPNIILITIDTLRADHLSSYGYHLKTSPRIDQLAEEGARFEKVYTVIPLTGPSHSSLFTSRYPQEHGARTNGTAVPRKSRWGRIFRTPRARGWNRSKRSKGFTQISLRHERFRRTISASRQP